VSESVQVNPSHSESHRVTPSHRSRRCAGARPATDLGWGSALLSRRPAPPAVFANAAAVQRSCRQLPPEEGRVQVHLFRLCNLTEVNIFPHLISADLVPSIARFANCQTKRFSMMLTYLSSEPHFCSFLFVQAYPCSDSIDFFEYLTDHRRQPCGRADF
jgi:hypothetical protein